MATMSPSQLQQLMQQHPDWGFKVNGQDVAPQPQKQNALISLLAGISKPFRAALQGATDLGAIAGTAGGTYTNVLDKKGKERVKQMVLANLNPLNAFESLGKMTGGYSPEGINQTFNTLQKPEIFGGGTGLPTLFGQDVQNEILQDPLRAGVKSGAGMAAFLVPGGEGVAGLAASGAASGALAGLGASKSGQELQGILGGGVTGGALGGGIGLASKYLPKALGGVGSKIEGAGQGLEKSPLAFKATAGRSGVNNPAQAEEIQNALFDILKGEGKTVASPLENAKTLGDIKNAAIDTKSSILENMAGAGVKYNTADIRQGLMNIPEFKVSPEILTENTPVAKAMNMLENSGSTSGMGGALGREVSPTEMQKVISYIDKNIKWNPPGGSTVAKADVQQALKAMRQDLTDQLVTSHANMLQQPGLFEQQPLLSEVNKKIGTITNAERNGLLARMAQANEGRVAFAPTPISTALSVAPSLRAKVAAGVGSKIAGAGGLIKALAGGIGEASPQVLGGLTKAGAIGVPSSGVQIPAGGNPMVSTLAASQGQSDLAPLRQQISQLQAPGNIDGNTAYMMAQQQLAGVKHTNSDIVALSNYIMNSSGQKRLPAAAQKDVSDMQSAVDSLDQLEQLVVANQNKFGLITGNIGKRNPLDTQSQAINQALSAQGRTLARGIEGSRLTDADFKYYEANVIPKLNDTPQVALAKIQYLKNLAAMKMSNRIQQYQSGMWDSGNATDTTDTSQ